MLGFVASLLLLIAGRLTGAAYSLCVTGSRLGLYGASLLFGCQSDPGKQRVPAGRSVGLSPGGVGNSQKLVDVAGELEAETLGDVALDLDGLELELDDLAAAGADR